MTDTAILQLTPDVKWIGVLDRDIVTFDIVMETKYGTTYNSYFINAQKKTIIETSKEKFWDVYESKVRQVVKPEEIEYIILDHTEPDHSGNLRNLLAIAPNVTVVGSGQALNYLQDIVGVPFRSLKVKDGDTLSLGNKTLRFIGAPNLHWPDSIYTYLEEDKILFTCDSFGAHFCHDEMFDDKVGDYSDAFKYYFDVILKPFSKFMLKAIEKIRPFEIKIIATGHGPVLRHDPWKIVDLSEKYSHEYLGTHESRINNVLVTYVSAYGYTRQMAQFVAKGLKQAGTLNVETVDIENIELGELESLIVRSNAVLVGSPTINQNTLLPVYRLFALINPIRDKGKLAAAFGSYGWSGEAVRIIEDNLKNLKLKIACDALNTKFQPHNGSAEKFIEFGKNIGLQVLEASKKTEEN
jgi:NADH oxidase (H2O-forming)